MCQVPHKVLGIQRCKVTYVIPCPYVANDLVDKIGIDKIVQQMNFKSEKCRNESVHNIQKGDNCNRYT